MSNLLSDKIKNARKQANLSQKDLGSALLVSEKAISSYESGRTKPSVEALIKIAQKTNKPMSFFTDAINEDLDVLKQLKEISTKLDEVLVEVRKTKPQ